MLFFTLFDCIFAGKLAWCVGVTQINKIQENEIEEGQKEKRRVQKEKDTEQHNTGCHFSSMTLQYLEQLMDYGTEVECCYKDEEALITYHKTGCKCQKMGCQSADDNVVYHQRNNCTSPSIAEFPACSYNTQLAVIQEKVTGLFNSKNHEEMIESKRMEWRLVALILDKLCFYLFLLVYLVTVFWVLSLAPHYVS